MDDPKRNPWLRDLPRVKDIIDIAVRELSFTDASKIRSLPPHRVVTALERKCYEIYNRYERKVRERFRKGEYGNYSYRDFETSLANSRRKRAGMTLEILFTRLLDLFRIPAEKPSGLGEAEFDFVVPDSITLRRDPRKAVLISLKREVRERWKLTVGDAYILRKIYGFPDNIWFVSLFDPPLGAVRIFLKLKIRVYVPNGAYDRIREGLGDLSEEQLSGLRRFSQIFDDLKPFARSFQTRLL